MYCSQIVVFSDGVPTSGMEDPTYIRSSMQKANIEQIPIYSFVFGDGSNKWAFDHLLNP